MHKRGRRVGIKDVPAQRFQGSGVDPGRCDAIEGRGEPRPQRIPIHGPGARLIRGRFTAPASSVAIDPAHVLSPAARLCRASR
jgi:hypothetical protein